jgi:hypothetical protein
LFSRSNAAVAATVPPSKPLLAVLCAHERDAATAPTGVTEPGVYDVVPLSVATGNIKVYFTAVSTSHRLWELRSLANGRLL